MKRSKGLARTGSLARRSRLRAKPKPSEQRDAEEAVRAVVFTRDRRCLMAAIEPERCWGVLTPHHLQKASARGRYDPSNLVALCQRHNRRSTHMANCRGCEAPIRWALTDKGKGIPLDPEPVENGNLVLDGEAGDGRPVVRYVRKGEDTGILPRYVAHFATCPNADDFKKR